MPRIFDNISQQLFRREIETNFESLNYIINYDIKYRMGLNGEEADVDD